MDNVFFSTQNYRKIYNIIENNIRKSYNVTISSTPTYKKKIIDTMKYVYNNRREFNIPKNMSSIDKSVYLSQKTIKIFMLYENDTRVVPTREHNEYKHSINTNTFDSVIINNPPSNNNQLLRELHTSSSSQINKLSERPNIVLKQDSRNQVELNLKRNINARNEIKNKPVDIDFRDNSVSEFEGVNIDNKYQELAELREREYEPAEKKTTDFLELTGTNNYANVREPNNRNSFLEQPEFKIEKKTLSNAIQRKLEPKPLNTDELLDNLQKIEPDNTVPDEFIKTEEPNKIITNNGIFETEGFEDFSGFDSQSDLLMTPLYNRDSGVSMDELINEHVETLDNSDNNKIEIGEKFKDESNIQNDKIDKIAHLFESFIESNNKIEAIETNINQMFYALKDRDDYKTETHTLHLRIDPEIDFSYMSNDHMTKGEREAHNNTSREILKGSRDEATDTHTQEKIALNNQLKTIGFYNESGRGGVEDLETLINFIYGICGSGSGGDCDISEIKEYLNKISIDIPDKTNFSDKYNYFRQKLGDFLMGCNGGAGLNSTLFTPSTDDTLWTFPSATTNINDSVNAAANSWYQNGYIKFSPYDGLAGGYNSPCGVAQKNELLGAIDAIDNPVDLAILGTGGFIFLKNNISNIEPAYTQYTQPMPSNPKSYIHNTGGKSVDTLKGENKTRYSDIYYSVKNSLEQWDTAVNNYINALQESYITDIKQEFLDSKGETPYQHLLNIATKLIERQREKVATAFVALKKAEDAHNNYDSSKISEESGCQDECAPDLCVNKLSGKIKSCFWGGAKVRVKFPLIKNVISVRLKKVIAPVSQMEASESINGGVGITLSDLNQPCGSGALPACDCGSGGGSFCNVPFYYLMIDELKSDIIQGHSIYGDNSLILEETPFCKMYFDDWWPKKTFSNCFPHIYFSNEDGDKTVFKTPKATLDTMTLSIRKPGKDSKPANIKTCGPTYLFFEIKTIPNYAGWETIEPTI